MFQTKKILACVDKSSYANHVADYGAWAAQKLSLPLELLHVIDRHQETASSDDHSGAIGIDAQENLLCRLAKEEGERAKEVRERGRIFLNDLRRRCELNGSISIDVKQRYGQLIDTLNEEQDVVALYVLGRRGESAAETQRDLGRHVELISRQIRRPILTVAGSFSEPRAALVAYDGRKMSRRGVELIAANSQLNDIPFHIVMSGRSSKDAEKHLNWAEEKLVSQGFCVHTAYLPGDPEQQITKAISEREIDLLVMGAYSRSPWRTIFFGSRTNDLLRASKVPTVTIHV